jgi:hypothetical protein
MRTIIKSTAYLIITIAILSACMATEASNPLEGFSSPMVEEKQGDNQGGIVLANELIINVSKLDNVASPFTNEQLRVNATGLPIEWFEIKPHYTSIEISSIDSEGLYRIGAWLEGPGWNWQYGFINGEGKIVIPIMYKDALCFEEGLCSVGDMYIDISGKEIIDARKYDAAGSFEFGFARVWLNKKCGLIDKAGKEILSCEYDFVGWHKSGLIWAGNYEILFNTNEEVEHDSRKYWLFDSTGNRIDEMEYDYVGLEYMGEPMQDAKYFEIANETISVLAKKNGKWGAIDKTGKPVLTFEYDLLSSVNEGIFAALKNGKWACIKSDGEVITKFQFDWVYLFNGGLAMVRIDNKYGYIDINGNLVISCDYDNESHPYYGKVAVSKVIGSDVYTFIIDKNGRIITGPKDYYIDIEDDMFIGKKYDTIGESAILDANGNRLMRFCNIGIWGIKDGLAIASSYIDGEVKRGIINQYGVEIIPLLFNDIIIANSGTCFVTVLNSNGHNRRVGILKLPPDAATRKPPLSERPITVYLNGLDLYFDTEPTIINGRTMVPMRKIFEMLDADVKWSDKEKKVTATKGKTKIELTIGSDTALINKEPIGLDSPAIIENSRTLVPLRFIAEALDCDVSWEAENRRAIITTDRLP